MLRYRVRRVTLYIVLNVTHCITSSFRTLLRWTNSVLYTCEWELSYNGWHTKLLSDRGFFVIDAFVGVLWAHLTKFHTRIFIISFVYTNMHKYTVMFTTIIMQYLKTLDIAVNENDGQSSMKFVPENLFQSLQKLEADFSLFRRSVCDWRQTSVFGVSSPWCFEKTFLTHFQSGW